MCVCVCGWGGEYRTYDREVLHVHIQSVAEQLHVDNLSSAEEK